MLYEARPGVSQCLSLCVMDEQSPWLLCYREIQTHDSEPAFPFQRTRLQILNLSDPTKHIAINIDSPNTEYEAEGLTVTNVKILSKVFRYASRNPVKRSTDIGTNGAIPNCLSS